ncbi:TadE/TadG family type IV pilus assembly protein [Maricaulis sp. CAU 1757]
MRGDVRQLPRRFRRDRGGASALEFALVAPALIFIIVGVLQISLALYKGATVQWVTERSLRVAMLDASVDAERLRQDIEAELAALGQDLVIDLDFAVDHSGAVPVGRVQVGYTHAVHLPLMEPIQARFSVDSSVPMPRGS